MKIEHTLKPSNEDIDFLTQKINDENDIGSSAYPFAFFIRDNNNNIIAGCNGFVIYGAIYTDQLWVHPDYRKQGLGRKLMDHVHKYGRKTGCTMATLSTLSFQNARHFYEHLGYQCDFERPGYFNNATGIFLKFDLL